jgi:hypothetical protein
MWKPSKGGPVKRFVNSRESATKAQMLPGHIKGVVEVKNNLVVK